MRLVNKNTEFFTTCCPEETLDEITGYFEEKGYKVNVAQDKYKVKVTLPISGESDLEMCVRILKAAPEKYCVEFNRTGGDQLEFFKQFNIIKEELDLEDATY
jgi:hypothetical protein